LKYVHSFMNCSQILQVEMFKSSDRIQNMKMNTFFCLKPKMLTNERGKTTMIIQ